jgi:hypothetical protein
LRISEQLMGDIASSDIALQSGHFSSTRVLTAKMAI